MYALVSMAVYMYLALFMIMLASGLVRVVGEDGFEGVPKTDGMGDTDRLARRPAVLQTDACSTAQGRRCTSSAQVHQCRVSGPHTE